MFTESLDHCFPKKTTTTKYRNFSHDAITEAGCSRPSESSHVARKGSLVLFLLGILNRNHTVYGKERGGEREEEKKKHIDLQSIPPTDLDSAVQVALQWGRAGKACLTRFCLQF